MLSAILIGTLLVVVGSLGVRWTAPRAASAFAQANRPPVAVRAAATGEASL